jgi:hypothetical protein
VLKIVKHLEVSKCTIYGVTQLLCNLDFSAKMPKPKEEDVRIKKIAHEIKRLRVEKGYTSYENFALDYDIGRMQYWRIEKGTNFTISTLLRILDIHQISLSEFFARFDQIGKI